MDNLTLISVLTIVLFIVGSVPFLLFLSHRRRDLLEAIYPATAYFLLIFPIRSVYALVFGTTFLGEPPFDDATSNAWMLALSYASIAFVMFLLGYYAPLGPAIAKSCPRLPSDWGWGRVGPAALTLAGVGLGAYGLLIRYFGGLEVYLTQKWVTLTQGGTTYLYALTGCLGLSSSILYVRYLRSGNGRVLFVTVLLLTIALGMTAGAKGAVFFPILSVLIVRHYLLRPIRLGDVFVMTLLLMLIIPAFNVYRHAPRLDAILPNYVQIMTTPRLLLTHILDRFHDMDALIYVVRDTGHIFPFRFGETLVPILVAWTPRVLWPDKPVISFAKEFGETYWAEWFAGTGSAPSVTVLGEAYINFGIAGMVLMGGLCGVVLRWWYCYCIRRDLGLGGVVAYAFTVPYWAMFWESDIVGLITRAILSASLAVMMSLAVGRPHSATGDSEEHSA